MTSLTVDNSSFPDVEILRFSGVLLPSEIDQNFLDNWVHLPNPNKATVFDLTHAHVTFGDGFTVFCDVLRTMLQQKRAFTIVQVGMRFTNIASTHNLFPVVTTYPSVAEAVKALQSANVQALA